MSRTKLYLCIPCFFFAAGCLGSQYQAPELSGLEEVGRYPNSNDVCIALDANEVTRRVTRETSGLIGCPTHETGAIKDRVSEDFTQVGVIDGWTILHHDPVIKSKKSLEIPDYLKGRTVMHYDSFHKTQLTYYTENGREWLWYPGNRAALMGHIKVRANQICFAYPNSSINPATGVAGPEWECAPLERFTAGIIDSVEGDIFNLSSGRIPFVMPKRRYSFDQLKSKLAGH